jgi:hypothetical protein
MQDRIGVVFDHNVFTVQFLYERLPLYIVALYPAVTTLAFEIVRVLGVFGRRHGLILGSVCVGFVHHCFYEVFDQLGPKLRWWQWNTDNPINHPMFASVPMTSMYIFATLGPAVLTFLVMSRPSSRMGLAWRTAGAGLLVPLGLAILSVPSSLFSGHVQAQAAVFAVEIAVFALIAVPVLVRQRRTQVPPPNAFLGIFGPVYLGVLAALWISAPPGAVPAEGLAYAAICFALAAFWLVMARPAAAKAPVTQAEAQV